MIKTILVGSLLCASACTVYPNEACTVPIGTSWSKELEGLDRRGLLMVGPPAPIVAADGVAECLPDAGTGPHACRRIVGRPYSGAACNEGIVGCYVWVQDDKVVGRMGLCWN